MGREIANNTLHAPRISQGDSLKGAAIILVVFGHALEPLLHMPNAMYIYMAIYSFHMPLFVFIAGVFTRPTITNTDSINIIKRIAIPLIAFHTAYTIFTKFIPGGYRYSSLQPYWHLWFLLSLIYWRLLLPIFWSPIGLIISVVAAIYAGKYPSIGMDFSLSRSIYFFPFFLAGSLYGRSLLIIISRSRRWTWLLLATTIMITMIWTYYGLHEWNLRGSFPYSSIAALTNEPEIGRALLMFIGLLGCIGFASIIPSKSRPLEYLGQNVLAIYLLHGFIVIVYFNFAEYVPMNLIGILLVFIISIFACFSLAPLQHPIELLSNRAYNLISKTNTSISARIDRKH